MKKITIIIIASLIIALSSCVKENDNQEIFPMVEIISPSPCAILYFDETITYKIRFTDESGSGLGNLAMDIHNNFNHHTHGSHLSCDMDPQKEPVNPYENAWVFSLPSDKSEYIFETEIMIPSKDGDSNIHDHGDYHYHIYVTNNDGYQSFTTLDIKLLHKTD